MHPINCFTDSDKSIYRKFPSMLPSNCNLLVCYSKVVRVSDRAVQGEDPRTTACWNSGFQSRRRHGCLSLASAMCCQVEVSAMHQPLVTRSLLWCDLEPSTMGRPLPTSGYCATERERERERETQNGSSRAGY